MSMEQLTIEVPSELKARLLAEATRRGMTVSEFVRDRIEVLSPEEEEALSEVLRAASESVTETRMHIRSTLDETNKILAELREKRLAREREQQLRRGPAAEQGDARK